MSARYWVLVPDGQFACPDTQWPPGMRPVLPSERRGPAVSPRGPAALNWREFADDGADQELDGRKVSVVARDEGSGVFISERRIIE